MRLQPILFWISWCLLLPEMMFSQGEGRFKHFTTQNGLSQNSSQCILQDHYGFMWIGTQDGINRYDGYSFVIYKPVPGDSTSLPGNSVRALLEDSKGNLWIGTRSGLARYDRAANKFVRYDGTKDSTSGPTSNIIMDIEEDKQGNIWFATVDQGISIYDPSTGKFRMMRHSDTNPNSLPGNDTRGIACGQDGHLWIATWSSGICDYDPATGKFSFMTVQPGQLNYPNTRGAIYVARSGKVYIGTWGKGFDIWDPVTKSMEYIGIGDNSDDPRGMIWNICEDAKGRIWAATAETGLVMFDPVTKTVVRYMNDPNDPTTINDNNIWCVTVDRSGLIWCGSWQGGVSVLNERLLAFSHYYKKAGDDNGLPSNMIWSMCGDGADGIWIGTAAGPVHYDRKTNSYTRTPMAPEAEDAPSSLSNIQTLCRQPDGTVWMGTTGGGIHSYDPVAKKYKVYKFIKQPYAPNSSIISASMVDDSGQVWIGAGAMIQCYDKAIDGFVSFPFADKDSVPASNTSVTTITQADHQHLRVGLSSGQLFLFDKTTGKFTFEWRTPSEDIACVVPDEFGGLWVGTGGMGLYYLKGGQATAFTEKEGLPNNSVYAIVRGDGDELWLATNKGVCKFNPLTKEIRNYTYEDGLQGEEYNQQAFFKFGDGQIWLGGTNGITAFYPADVKVNQSPARAMITSFTVLNKPYPMNEDIQVAKEIQLSWRDYFFSFEFTGLEFSIPSKNQYKYMMVGFDEDWVDAGDRRYVTYTNLDPGEYTFRVMASNNDGVWNGEIAEVKIIIDPPFWRTNWFYTLCGFVLISGTWGYIRVREKKLRVEKEVLESKVEERTAELKDEKEKVSAAHKDIRDSINYARRIQDSILPSDNEWKESLPDSFVLYMPRDIVSGDFYWLANTENSTVMVAAADCTGHGVPGAFMSMIGNTLLNEAVKQKKQNEPALVLNGLHKDIRTALRQDAGSETRDGMDVAIVKLNFKEGSVDYAGANRPLLLVHDGELREVRADKIPIGGLQGEEERNFTGHSFHVKKGTMIYIFTDGFADQFGGEKGKKFMVRKFYDMLKEIASLSCVEQHTILSHAILNWKGAHEQVDDILVIGVRM